MEIERAAIALTRGEQTIDVGVTSHCTANESTVLLHAALAGNTLPVLVRRLVFAGADVTARDAHGNTPLHLAASRGYEPLCDLLIARGGDAHALSDDKTTPAMLSIARGFPELGAKLAAVSDEDAESNG